MRQSQSVREHHGGGGAHRLQGHQGLQLGGTGLAEHISHLVHLGQMLIRNEATENHAVRHAAIVRLLLESLTQLTTTGDVQHHVLEGIRQQGERLDEHVYVLLFSQATHEGDTQLTGNLAGVSTLSQLVVTDLNTVRNGHDRAIKIAQFAHRIRTNLGGGGNDRSLGEAETHILPGCLPNHALHYGGEGQERIQVRRHEVVGCNHTDTAALRLEDEGTTNNVVALHVHHVRADLVEDCADLGPDLPGQADAVRLVGRGQVRAQTVLHDAALYFGTVARTGDGAGSDDVYGVAALEHGGGEAVTELCCTVDVRRVGFCANQNRLCLFHDGAPHRGVVVGDFGGSGATVRRFYLYLPGAPGGSSTYSICLFYL